MKTIKEILEIHKENKYYSVFKGKLPRMYEFSAEVEIIPWQDEYAIADRNPEIIDEIEFWEYLLKNNLITQKEFDEKMKSIPRVYASKTLAISFKETNQVSFREEFPPFPTILHELGHCFFKEDDPIWSSVRGGGESIMWLILEGKLKGDEETIRKYHSLLHLGYINPQKLEEFLNEVAEEIIQKRNINLDKIELPFDLPATPLNYYCLGAGWIRTPETDAIDVLIEAVEGTRHLDGWWVVLLNEVLRKQDKLGKGYRRVLCN